ncbi:hypothetical protein D3C78_1133400 [compost metagenome]
MLQQRRDRGSLSAPTGIGRQQEEGYRAELFAMHHAIDAQCRRCTAKGENQRCLIRADAIKQYAAEIFRGNADDKRQGGHPAHLFDGKAFLVGQVGREPGAGSPQIAEGGDLDKHDPAEHRGAPGEGKSIPNALQDRSWVNGTRRQCGGMDKQPYQRQPQQQVDQRQQIERNRPAEVRHQEAHQRKANHQPQRDAQSADRIGLAALIGSEVIADIHGFQREQRALTDTQQCAHRK